MSLDSTYNLSQALRALGVRDRRAVPSIDTAKLTPTISFGAIETFAPQVIEARGVCSTGPNLTLAGQWIAHAMFSLAEGGSIIERIFWAAGAAANAINMAPQRPFIGGNLGVFSMGGRPLNNLHSTSGVNVGPAPDGAALGGSSGGLISGNDLFEGIWVPPGWHFWITQFGNPGFGAATSIRWREVPEGQGPA